MYIKTQKNKTNKNTKNIKNVTKEVYKKQIKNNKKNI